MFIALLALLAVQASGEEVLQVCVTTPTACRAMQPFDVFIAGEAVTLGNESVLPWFDDGVLMLAPGEGLVMELSPDGPKVRAAVAAKSVLTDAWVAEALGAVDRSTGDLQAQPGGKQPLVGPKGSIRISFRQGTGVEHMFLVVENGGEKLLSYRAHMVVLGPEGLQVAPTTVCTAPPSTPVVEHWPHPIMSLLLSDFRYEDGGEIVCR